MSDDRTVHASNGAREIVRYDRAGKWYVELKGLPRIPVTLAQAAKEARSYGWVHHPGLPGGARFDRLVSAG